MTNQEAIKILQELTNGLIGHGIILRANNLAISALEKQIPKPPEYKVRPEYLPLGRDYYCTCGVMFLDFKRNGTNYCGNCGQKLK